jgi:hypothetical protein
VNRDEVTAAVDTVVHLNFKNDIMCYLGRSGKNYDNFKVIKLTRAGMAHLKSCVDDRLISVPPTNVEPGPRKWRESDFTFWWDCDSVAIRRKDGEIGRVMLGTPGMGPAITTVYDLDAAADERVRDLIDANREQLEIPEEIQ